MKMKYKNRSRLLPVILILAVIAVLAVILAPRLVSQSKVVQTLQTKEKDKEIARLEAVMMEIKDKDSQEYKEAKQQYCLLKSRPAAERGQAVANVREFLGMPTVDVEFDCGRGNFEYYTAARFSFIIDPANNHIVEVGEAERRWGTKEDGTRWFDPIPEYDYTPRYATPETIRPVAEKFLTDHKDIFGIDITKMTYEFEGTKPGNFFLKWKTVDENGKTKELVSVTITTGGQVIVYDNDTYDLAKNER